MASPLGWLVLILLIAAALRIYGIHDLSPPGLEHDEVANFLIDRAILEGRHGVYFMEAYGHEAGFHYLQSLSIAILGDHALALRLPAVFSGLLLVAIQYTLTRRLFGRNMALLSMAILAVLFWPVFYSRLGLRAILLPLISGFTLYFWWQAWLITGQRSNGAQDSVWVVSPKHPSGLFWFAVAGLFAGLTLYTYMAARAVPIFFTIFVFYLAVFHRTQFRGKWRGILLFFFLLALVALPLVIFLQSNPGAEFRITEIDAPLRALLSGNLRPVLDNSIKIVGMFGLKGDPLWRQNIAGKPVYGPVLAFLFYLGLLVAVWRWRDARYAYLLLWLGVAAIPSLVTIDAPSSIRMINGLLVVTVLPTLFMHIIPSFSTERGTLSTGTAYLLALLVIGTHIWRTADGIFHTWPQNEEVQFVWQAALTDTAEFLDRSPDRAPVAIGGWSPATLDPATMFLSMRRRDLSMRYFGSDSMTLPITTIIVPAAGDGMRLTHPTIRPLAPGLEEQLLQWGAAKHHMDTFVLYDIEDVELLQAQQELEATFEGELQLLGTATAEGQSNCLDGSCSLLSYWRVLSTARESRRFFLHALDEKGSIVAQFDGLDAPAVQWQAGDLIVQEHLLEQFTGTPVELRLGVYDPENNRRLLLADGSDHVKIAHP